MMFTEEELKYYRNLEIFKRSKKIVETIFKDIKDKSGCPYIHHLKRVCEDFKEKNLKSMAIMHDSLEDTTLTIRDLQQLGYDDHFIKTIQLLTNNQQDYNRYIDKIIESNNLDAIKIKIKDLLHNMDILRFETPHKKDFERVRNKYIKAYIKLIDKLEGETKK